MFHRSPVQSLHKKRLHRLEALMASYPVDVFTLYYMKRLRFSLNSIAGWPHKVFGDSNITSKVSSVYRFILIILYYLDEFSTLTYLKKHINSDLGNTYVNVLMGNVSLQRLFLPFSDKFCLVLKKFTAEFHLMHHKHKTDYAGKVYDQVNKICTIVSSVSHLQVVLVVILYNMMPFYSSYKAGMFSEPKPKNATFQHSVDYELPFDQYTNNLGYFIVFFYNWYVSYNVAVGICIYDLLVFIIVFHIWGHLNILIHDLKYFSKVSPKNHVQSYSEAQEDLFNRLKDVVKHHQIIKEFMSQTSEAFSTTLCFYLMFHQLSGCVLLLKCSSLDPDALGRYGLVTFIIFQQLIETSVIFELIRDKGDTLAGEVYALPWEHMDVRTRRIVLTFLFNVQPSLALKAGGMVPVGVLTMSTILKTSCSYFIMLRTFTQLGF